MNKREKIVNITKSSPFMSLEEIAEQCDTSTHYVETTLSKENVSLREKRKKAFKELEAKYEQLANSQDFSELDVRPEIRKYARRMEVELRKHDGIDGENWKNMNKTELLKYLIDEVATVTEAIAEFNKDKIVKELIDIGNFAMFIYNKTLN